MPDQDVPPRGAAWEAEVKAMSDRLARESRRSGMIGFLGGAAVMAGLAILAWATMNQINKNKSLSAEVQTKTTLANEAQQQAATANAQAASARTVLSATVENLQSQNPAVSASATDALNQAFEADPNAARLLVRVDIHTHSADQRKRAQQVARALREAGFIVPGIDVKPEMVRETELHYYSDDSQSVSDATAIVKAVEAIGLAARKRQVPQPQTGHPRPRDYGLWLASDLQ
jgi:cell division protein FtsB